MSQYSQLPSSTLQSSVLCDLRSDTVTQPDAAMRQAMYDAEVGDDVYGEDPTVSRLEAHLAERLGKEAGLFVPTGTQSNLIAIMAHCGRGEEVMTGRDYHVAVYEAGGAAVLGSCVYEPLAVASDGGIEAADIAAAVKEDDAHHAVSKLLSLENTHNGCAVPLDRCEAAVAAARQAGLATHLDGARYFNAIADLRCADDALAHPFDTISVCLSKGLGAPVGSVLVGPAALIRKGRRLRKMLGGGMRQAGVLAAAGLYALDQNVARLQEDHNKARIFADALTKAKLGQVVQNTNMVFFTPDPAARPIFVAAMQNAGVRISAGDLGAIRMVFHKDVEDHAFSSLKVAVEKLS